MTKVNIKYLNGMYTHIIPIYLYIFNNIICIKKRFSYYIRNSNLHTKKNEKLFFHLYFDKPYLHIIRDFRF